MRDTGHVLDSIRGIFVLADIRVAQGRLRDAAGIARALLDRDDAVDLAEHGEGDDRGVVEVE